MATVVTMPRLSDTMTEGTVATWLKKVGDTIKEGDILAEIETDKATMEFESFNAGVLLHIGIQEGQSAPVDSLLAIIGQAGEDISALLNGGTPALAANVTADAPAATPTVTSAPAAAAPASKKAISWLKSKPIRLPWSLNHFIPEPYYTLVFKKENRLL
jgi:pyruvate dehydrogenase E2 component (dihydrolipoamide acetyltransferase)